MKSYYTSTRWQDHNSTIQCNLKELIIDLKTKGKWDTSPSNQKTGFMTRTNPPETRGEISWNQQNNQRRKLSTTETFEGFKKQPATAYSTATSRFCFFFFFYFLWPQLQPYQLYLSRIVTKPQFLAMSRIMTKPWLQLLFKTLWYIDLE